MSGRMSAARKDNPEDPTYITVVGQDDLRQFGLQIAMYSAIGYAMHGYTRTIVLNGLVWHYQAMIKPLFIDVV